MYKVINTVEGVTIFIGNGHDFIDFTREIVKENDDVDYSVLGVSDASEYINVYCDNLQLIEFFNF